MRIEVVGRNVEITPAIREYALSKAEKLPKFYSGVQQITVLVARANAHHTTDFEVEIVADVQHHDDFVSHAKGSDPYAAIDICVEKCERQLREFKEKIKH